MSEPSPTPSYVPTERADVDSTGITQVGRPIASQAALATDRCLQRPRKYADGRELRKKNSKGILEFHVKVVSARYSTAYHRWEYKLQDLNDVEIVGTTKEKDLG
ncbi:MAG: hypothetical protein Q9172_007501 [Xanthocarpia lactea]